MGFGLLAFGLGFVPFLLGAILELYRVRRYGAHGSWITLVSIGITGTAILLWGYLAPRAENTWFPENYFYMLIPFAVLVLLGLAWRLAEARQRQQGLTGSKQDT